MALTQEEIRVLDLLYQDARITPERAAVMLGMTEQAVTEAIRHLEEERVIVGYPALINWDKTPIEKVKAVIEVKVTPQRDRGFDAIAERIYRFDEVKSVYLMSGAYDLLLLVEAHTLKELAFFVSTKLSTLETVTGTATHFVLKRYKSDDTLASVGVDVSSHQQEIDWELVAANGVEFAMIRVGYRGYTEGEIQPDDYFVQNIEGARAAGLDVGVYFFSQALDEQEAIDEANYVLEQIKDYPLSYPVIFDWEDIEADARTDGMDSVQLTKNAIAFCDTIKQAGYRAGVYFNQRFGYEEFDLESLQDYVFWLAEYNDTPSFSFHFQIWQYCNDGRVDGIKTDVDLNLAFLRAKH